MDNPPSQPANTASAAPEAEVLKPRPVDVATAAGTPPAPTASNPATVGKKPRRGSHLPSHKATFIGLAVIITILAINVAILGFVIRKQDKDKDLFNKGQVSISTEELNRLGINRSVIGDSGVELVVAPDAQFKGKVSISGDTTISSPVVLNAKLTAADGSLTQLQAGNTALEELNVNGKSSLSDLVLRKDLVVSGLTHLQGQATFSQAVAVNNSLSVTGNLIVGGQLSVSTFSVQNLAIGKHIITSGGTPSVSKGSAVGSNGTVTISGNDTAGTVSINVGTGASGGTLANINFKTQYGGSPKVVISPVGTGGLFYVTSIGTDGFSIGVNSALSPGGYKINYIVVQ